jgi:hypothetical protein
MTDPLTELPPQSRISSRIDGSEMTILIPRSARIAGGWIPTGLMIAFGFLAVTCTAQGVLTQNPRWFIAGLFFFVLAGWQLLAHLGPMLKTPSQIKLQITQEFLTATIGSAEAQTSRHWPRSTISSIRAEPPKLNIYLTSRDTPVCILSDLEPAELLWIAEQIRVRWGRETG